MNGEGYGRDSGRREHYSRHDREDRRGGGGGGDRGDRERGGDRDRRENRGGDRERRRSRSPHHRPRREHGDVDSYSSSRDYRAREREERYDSGRREPPRDQNRDQGREWNRDRGPRRRDDDRGGPRRERGGGGGGDLFDDRRGGGRGPPRGEDRGAREDRSEFAEQARGGEPARSPPPKKREPTPDLTDVVSVLERRRRLTQWDIKPPGYENVTAEQAKMSGMFPLPGAPRQQQMDPSKLQAFINQPQGNAATTALKPSNARQSKRLFASNIPPTASEQDIIDFFNLQLNGLNVIKSNDPCISANMPDDKSFALIEFKLPSEATVALALDGITMEQHHSAMNGNGDATIKGLEIKRPKDYIVPSAEEDAYVGGEGEMSPEVPDTANKICISNLPSYLTDDQVLELLKSFGDLKAFVLVKDNGTQESRGIGFAEYVDAGNTAIAVEGLNGMDLADTKIKVTRASIGFTQAAGLEMGVNAMSMFAGTQSSELEGGRVLQLLNMITPEELIDDEEYEEICEDILSECGKYGTIATMKIPRPSGGSRQSAGVGKIFIKYEKGEDAKKALEALAGRKFADRTVVVTWFDEASFDVNAW